MLDIPLEDGSRTRDHLRAVERATGKPPEDLETGQLPDPLRYLWEWYIELHDERPVGAMGEAGRITSRVIQDWLWATRRNLAAWEIEVIKDIDRAFHKARAESQEVKR